MTRRDARPRRWLTLAPAVALVATTAACGDDGLDLPDPPAAPPTPPSATPTLDPAHRAIHESFEGAINATLAAHQAGDPEHPSLTSYYLDPSPALHNLKQTIRRNEDLGYLYGGGLRIVSAEVTEFAPDDSPPRATLEACVDYSDYELVHRADESPVQDEEPLEQYPTTVILTHGIDDNWYIVDQTAHWDEQC